MRWILPLPTPTTKNSVLTKAFCGGDSAYSKEKKKKNGGRSKGGGASHIGGVNKTGFSFMGWISTHATTTPTTSTQQAQLDLSKGSVAEWMALVQTTTTATRMRPGQLGCIQRQFCEVDRMALMQTMTRGKKKNVFEEGLRGTRARIRIGGLRSQPKQVPRAGFHTILCPENCDFI